MSVLKKNLSAQRSRETLNRLFTILLWAVWSINPRFGWYLPVLEMQNDHILLHMFLCYIMFCIHFLNISRQGRRKSRWNKRIAEQNPGGVEAGALYGGENTCQVNERSILFGKPQFVDFGINVIHVFKWLWKVFWRAVSVFIINVYEHKNTNTCTAVI